MAERESGTPSTAGSSAAAVAAHASMPGLHGNLSAFDSSQEDWIEYVERLDYYFVANEIDDPAKKRAILLTAVGPTTYRLIRTLCLPGKPQDETYSDLVERVKTHFNPKPSPIIMRYEFNNRKQRPG